LRLAGVVGRCRERATIAMGVAVGSTDSSDARPSKAHRMSDIFDTFTIGEYGFTMAPLHDLGKAIHVRRFEMGLTQASLARLSGLTRQTINQVENGTVKDLSLNRAEKLTGVLGLSLHVEQPHERQAIKLGTRMSALTRAAQTASVSYRKPLAPSRLRKVLVDGDAPLGYTPYLHALLDEAPTSLLASLAEQLHRESAMSREDLWKNFRKLAQQVKSRRDIWQ